MKVEMSIARALKEKSRIAEKLEDLRKKIALYNSVDIGKKPPLNVRSMLEQCEALEENFIRIRAAIAVANAPIERELFEMMVTRSRITFYAASTPAKRGRKRNFSRTASA